MLPHPTLVMIFFISILAFVRNGNKIIFKITALIFPIITWLLLMSSQGNDGYELYNLKLLWNYDESSKLICYAFLLVVFASNSYALSQNQIKELILGSTYGAFAIFTMLSNDFISMFAGLEIMMILSSIIIYIGDHKDSKTAAKRYFLTHLVSSNMILIGIVHVISQNNSTEIINLTNLIDNPKYSPAMLYIMLTGMIINIAAFPFSGWMANYYKEASSAGLLYLINFTTKVSIVLLIKIFAQAETLKYIAALTILYAGFKAYFEEHLLSLLCYLSIIAMGVMTIGISYGATDAVICYLFIHIIYKSLLSLSVVIWRGSTVILRERSDRQDPEKLKNTIKELDPYVGLRRPPQDDGVGLLPPRNDVAGALILGLALMINSPLSLSYFSKLDIAHMVGNGPFYWLILLANVMTIIALPWRRNIGVIASQALQSHKARVTYVASPEIATHSPNARNDGFILPPPTLIAFLLGFLGIFLPYIHNLHSIHETNSYSLDIIKQITIFVISSLVIIKINQPKKIGKGFNLIDFIGDVWTYFHHKFLQKKDSENTKETWNLDALEDQFMRKIFLFHNGQTAIFVVFLLFILMLLILNSSMG